VLLKNESSRFGLPAFKFLGASWGAYRAIAQLVDYTDDNSDTSYGSLKRAIASFGSPITLFAATEGNHGRAVAHVATLLGVKSHIFVPQHLYKSTKSLIIAEGATLTNVAGDYDLAMQMAYDKTRVTQSGLYIQDTAFDSFEEIPQVRSHMVLNFCSLPSLIDGFEVDSGWIRKPCFKKLMIKLPF
jgi:threonine dehydratase